MALLDTQVAMLANLGANYLATGVAPQRAGNAHQNIVPYQVFEVADGHMILAVGNDGQFASSATSPAAPSSRTTRASRATPTACATARPSCRCWRRVLKRRTRADWLAALEAAKVPCGPINDLAEVFADPQVRARGMTVDDAASARRHGAPGRQPDQAVGDAGALPPAAAAAGRRHRRSAGRARPGRRGDRAHCAAPARSEARRTRIAAAKL